MQESIVLRDKMQSSMAHPAAGSQWQNLTTWISQIAVAAILGQTLFFKFTYAPETQVIFANRGGRPAATIVGLLELCCVVMLLIPRAAFFGGVFAMALMSGAIFTHLTSLGIQITDPVSGERDGGLLFALALTAFVGSAFVLYFRRASIFELLSKLR